MYNVRGGSRQGNRFRLDKRKDDTYQNNNPRKWQRHTTQLKTTLPASTKPKKLTNEKIIHCTFYKHDGYCRNGEPISAASFIITRDV